MNVLEGSRKEVVKRAELSLTPMIDVVFLLLIFFMVGMKFKELDRKLEADLPKAGKPLEDDTQPPPSEIWVIIKKDPASATPSPKIVIDQRPYTKWEDVRDTLANLARLPGAKKDPVIVAPDADAWHGWVMKVLDYLHQLDFRNINFKQ